MSGFSTAPSLWPYSFSRHAISRTVSGGRFVAGTIHHPGFKQGQLTVPGFKAGEAYKPGFKAGAH